MTIDWKGQLRAGRACLAIGCAVLAIGLPLGLEVTAPETGVRRSAALAGSGDKMSVGSRTLLAPGLPLFIEGGTINSVAQTGAKETETIGQLAVDGATFRLALGADAASDAWAIDGGASLAPLLAQLGAMNFKTLAIRRSTVDFVSADGWTITLRDVSVDVTASRRGAFHLKGTASFLGQGIRLDVSGAVPTEARAAANRRASAPIKIAVSSSLLDATLDGRLIAGEGLKLSGSADFKAKKLRSLARWFGLQVPSASDLRDASIVGPMEWGGGVLAFQKASVVVDGNSGEGALQLRLGGERPSIDGTLDFKVFDIGPQLAAQMLRADPKQGQEGAKEGSLASAFDADLRLSTAKIKILGMEAGRAAATLTLRSGKMQADLAELEIEGGVVQGQATLDVNGAAPRLGIKGKLTGIDPGRIFTEPLKRNPLMGRANIVMEGAGHGHTLPDMLADFTGKAHFSIPAGGKIGLDLKALAYSARNAKHVGWAAAGKGATPFEQLDARVQIAKGAMTLEDARAKAPGLVASSGGKIDVPGRLLDLTVQLSSGEPASATSVPAVLVLRGSWADPAISLQGRPFTSPAPAVKGANAATPPPVGQK